MKKKKVVTYEIGKPVVMQPEKSTSYAVQWFALALALTIIYIVVNLKNSERELEDGE